MGFRFRRRISIAPGLRINVSKSGFSLSGGPRGASISAGRRGLYGNVGIPGTGLYARERLDSRGSNRGDGSGESSGEGTTVRVSLQDDGTVTFTDTSGQPIDQSLERRFKREQGDWLRQWLEERAADINQKMVLLERIHLSTPPPDSKPEFIPNKYEVPGPIAPIPKKVLWILRPLVRWFPSIQQRVDQDNATRAEKYETALEKYTVKTERFFRKEDRRRWLIEEGIYTDPSAMSDYLESRLNAMEWPRETAISHEIVDNGEKVRLDVDLPEIEDMPTRTASVPGRSYKVSIKELSDSRLRQLYMRHVHAVGFRVIGEVFASLPKCEYVVASGYSQRPDPATGVIRDDYLWSAVVARKQWEAIDFTNLDAINLVAAFDAFELHRKMTKTGVFTPVEPYE